MGKPVLLALLTLIVSVSAYLQDPCNDGAFQGGSLTDFNRGCSGEN